MALADEAGKQARNVSVWSTDGDSHIRLMVSRFDALLLYTLMGFFFYYVVDIDFYGYVCMYVWGKYIVIALFDLCITFYYYFSCFLGFILFSCVKFFSIYLSNLWV